MYFDYEDMGNSNSGILFFLPFLKSGIQALNHLTYSASERRTQASGAPYPKRVYELDLS